MLKKIAKIVLLNMFAASAFVIAGCGNDSNKTSSIVFTADLQGNVELIGKAGALRDSISDDSVFLLDGGNSVSGSVNAAISNGKDVSNILEAADYDAVVLSGKDIDCSGDLILNGTLDFCFLMNNLKKGSDQSLINGSSIVKINNVKSGILGLTDSLGNDIFSTVETDEVYELLNEYTAQYEKEKCDLVILTVTNGNKELCNDLSKEVKNVDIIISTGAEKNSIEENNGVFIVYKAVNGTEAGVITCNNGEYQVEYRSLEDYQIIDTIQTMIKAESEDIDKKIADCTQEMSGDPSQNETAFGDLVAEAVRKSSGADAALVDGNLFLKGIDAGELTGKELIEAVSDSQIVKMQLSGEELLNIVKEYVDNNDSILQSCGIVYTIDTTSKEVDIISINNELFNIDNDYTIAFCLSDYKYDEAMSTGVSATLHTALFNYVSQTLDGVIDENYSATKGMITYKDSSLAAIEPGIIRLYRHDKETHIRYLLDDFSGVFTTGENVGSFDSIAGSDDTYAWSDYKSEYRNLFYANSGSEQSKIGYKVKFTLKDGTEYNYVITEPDDTEPLFDYIEVYIYDDINQPDGAWYSHLTMDQITDNTLMTSIKLHGGAKIDEVQEIWLTNFVYNGEEDFNSDSGDYIGDVSYMINIHR